MYFKLVDKVQVISNFLANWAIELGVDKNKIVVVPNGVTVNSQQLTVDKNKKEKIILTVSRLVEKNGVEDLIKSIKILNQENIKLTIIGDGLLRNKLENLAQELNLVDKVKFLGDLPNQEALKYYSIADVFCRPSLSEGFGISFVEAMAAEVPVIATPVGGIPDFLKDNTRFFRGLHQIAGMRAIEPEAPQVFVLLCSCLRWIVLIIAPRSIPLLKPGLSQNSAFVPITHNPVHT